MAGADEGDMSAGRGPGFVTERDPGDMLGAIAGLPRQLTAGYAVARSVLGEVFGEAGLAAPPARPTGLAVCGMGGSAIGADLILACVPDLPIPATVVRGYELPAWVGPTTLVVIQSCSGDTEETLACLGDALARGCAPVCVASGGRLAAEARERGLPLVTIPGGQQPRATIGYLSMPLLAVLEAAGLARAHDADVAEAAELLREGNERYALGRGGAAEELADALFGRVAVVYGAGLSVPVARRWKGQINENAKAPAFWNELPEMNHNELVGWTSAPTFAKQAAVVLLRDPQASPALRRRSAVSCQFLGRLVAPEAVLEAVAEGASPLARAFSLVQLGDYVSYRLALLYGVDPTPVAAIQDFKSRLAGGAG